MPLHRQAMYGMMALQAFANYVTFATSLVPLLDKEGVDRAQAIINDFRDVSAAACNRYGCRSSDSKPWSGRMRLESSGRISLTS